MSYKCNVPLCQSTFYVCPTVKFWAVVWNVQCNFHLCEGWRRTWFSAHEFCFLLGLLAGGESCGLPRPPLFPLPIPGLGEHLLWFLPPAGVHFVQCFFQFRWLEKHFRYPNAQLIHVSFWTLGFVPCPYGGSRSSLEGSGCRLRRISAWGCQKRPLSPSVLDGWPVDTFSELWPRSVFGPLSELGLRS